MKIAALVLASGLSSRFGPKDKLLMDLKGRPLLAYCLDAVRSAQFEHRFIVCPDPDLRADLARDFDFAIIPNPYPVAGQGATIALGATYLVANGFDTICILLGDMPFVTSEYLTTMRDLDGDIVFSHAQGKDQPPALFRHDAMRMLTQLTGDQGARSLDLSQFEISSLDLPAEMSVDFNTEEDFKAV